MQHNFTPEYIAHKTKETNKTEHVSRTEFEYKNQEFNIQRSMFAHFI